MNPSRTVSAPIGRERPYQSPASKQPPAFPQGGQLSGGGTPPPSPQPQESPVVSSPPSSNAEMDAVWAGLLEFTDSIPPTIRAWALDLWDDIGVGQARPAHMRREAAGTITLGTAFQGGSRPALMRKRELHHQVRGVLSKASPENYDRVQAQLLALPIRQSDGDDIDKVVQVFFVKATDPSERLYAAFYARSFKALLDHIRDEETKRGVDLSNPDVSAYRRLKRSLLSKLQELYNSSAMLDELKNGDSLSDEQRTLKLSEFKANISFLGELFLTTLVQERLVSHVLYKLLFPDDNSLPKDYEVDQFFALIRVVGHRTTQEGVRRFTEAFVDKCETLIKEHPTKRTQFKAMDIRDMIRNGYVATKPGGALSKGDISKAEFNTAVARAEQRADKVPAVAPAPAAAAPRPEPPGMNADLFLKFAIAPAAFSDDEPPYFSTLRTLPPATVEAFYEQMIHTFLRPSEKYDQARRKLGTLSIQYVDKGIFTREKVVEMFNRQLVRFVDEDHVTDSPKCVEYLADIVTSSREASSKDSIFDFRSYTCFLTALMANEHPKTKEALYRLVNATSSQLQSDSQQKEAMSWSVEERRRLRRFRLLPVLLRCTHDGEDDFVDMFSAKEEGPASRDVILFAEFMNADISIPLWEKQFKVIFDFRRCLPINRVNDYWRLQLISSMFAFTRFDTNLLDKLHSVFDKPFKSLDFKKILPTVLVEIYETWVDLGRTPKSSLVDFYSRLGFTKTNFQDLQKYMREVAEDEEAALMIKKLA